MPMSETRLRGLYNEQHGKASQTIITLLSILYGDYKSGAFSLSDSLYSSYKFKAKNLSFGD
jgi:hypothetical protein